MTVPRGKVPVYTAPYALTPARDAHQRTLGAKGARALAAYKEAGEVPVRFRYLTDRQLQAGSNETLDWRQEYIERNNEQDGYPQPVFLP